MTAPLDLSAPINLVTIKIPGQQGPQGVAGPANVLSIGTVTTTAAGTSATATVTGTAPAQILNLTVPKGDKGDIGNIGPAGSAALMTIGTVTTGAAGSIASATITGTAPNYVLNLTIPRGDTGSVSAHTHVAADITNATTVGLSVMTAVDAPAARTAIGAGTSNLVIGTTSTTAKAGDYAPPADGAAGVATMRTLGTGATQAAAGNDARLSDARTPTAHTHTAVNISDSTTVGRSVMTAVDATAARTAIGAGTSSLVLGTTSTTAKAGDYSPPTSSETVVGTVELATAAETTTGTDNTRAVHPAGLKVELDKKANTTDVASAPIINRHNGTTVAARPNTTRPVWWIIPYSYTLATNGTTAGGTIAAVNGLDVVSRY